MTESTSGAATPADAPDAPEAVPGKAGRAGVHWLLGLVSVVVGGALVLGTAWLLGKMANVPPALSATRQSPNVATLSLSVWPDSLQGVHGSNGGPHPDWVTYGPSTTLTVPANSLVKMTILNYDTATTLNNAYYSSVHGTVGGVAYLNGVPFTSVSPSEVAHTFTIHMFPEGNQPALDVSVPMPGVSASAPNLANGYPKPVAVTFEFRTGAAGRYIWQCFDPCGGTQYTGGFGGPMSATGYMAGTITVGGNNA
jgi:hypothetical protein